jgi:hypothetical protein
MRWYGAPALHGILTPPWLGLNRCNGLDLQPVLRPPEAEAISFDDFSEFTWVVEKIEEWLLRIGRVFQQTPGRNDPYPCGSGKNINAVADGQFNQAAGSRRSKAFLCRRV